MVAVVTGAAGAPGQETLEPATQGQATREQATGEQATQEVQTVQVVPVAEGIAMLMGSGGNIGVFAGEDGVFLIDDQYAPLTDDVRGAIAEISERPMRFLLNTHWHPDHTGGNENLGKAGVLIVAHDNVREALKEEQFLEILDLSVPPSPPTALPVVTFSDTLTFHMNGEVVHAFHVSLAHTDGDSIVHFRNSNVVHVGDILFNGVYPYIDYAIGGSIDGMIEAGKAVLEIVDGDTRIIPGHGPLADREDLVRSVAMLEGARAKVAALKAVGKGLEEVIAAKPTAEWDEEWGDGIFSPAQFVEMVYESLGE
jgi:glyoxylase-like metal-dependent hydrolase (beta-lactamase superfamily II)